jgi:hypothetical protein
VLGFDTHGMAVENKHTQCTSCGKLDTFAKRIFGVEKHASLVLVVTAEVFKRPNVRLIMETLKEIELNVISQLHF